MHRTAERIAAILLFLLLQAACAAAQDRASAQPTIEFPSMPLRLGNLFLPGLLQTANGQPEGYGYMAGGPLAWGGTALLADYLLSGSDPSKLWEFGTGFSAEEIGASLIGYSEYAFLRDYRNERVDPALRRPREGYLELLSAPFVPENLFNIRVLPVLGLMVLPSLSGGSLSAMGQYFTRPSVSFFGARVTPAAGCALEGLFAVVVNLFVATAEELLFRGVLLDEAGPTLSAVTFGALHLTNAFSGLFAGSANPTEEAALQSASATAFGFYANSLTIDDGYRLDRSIALHYWNNVIAMELNYLSGSGIGGP
jgi:membrane protease YdiL (CAAX protease family)